MRDKEKGRGREADFEAEKFFTKIKAMLRCANDS